MSKLLCVVPILTERYADICVESLLMPNSAAGLLPDEILVVDNSRDGFAHKYGLRTYRDKNGHNLGVARSWNVGAREVLEGDYDYLVLMSCTLQFGPELHTTWRKQMEEFWGSRVIECTGMSWKLIALHRTCFEKIGLFDENFYPAYFEQTDWCYRLRMVNWEQGFVRVWCNVMSHGHALHTVVVSCPPKPLIDYYAIKWSGDKGTEKWVQPFGDKPLDFWENVPIPILAERYKLETWW